MSTDLSKAPILPKTSPVEGVEKTEADPTFRVIAGQVLDTGGRPFVPLAARWKAESDRRDDLRTGENRDAMFKADEEHRDAMRDLRKDQKAFEKAREEVQWWNVFNGERRAARAVVRDSRELARESARAKRDAKRDYPMPLRGVAARCHAAHLVPTAAWALLSDSYASSGAFILSVAAVALNTVGVALGMRHIRNDATTVAASETASALQPSQEESDLLERLDPGQFAEYAGPRGLSDVIAGESKLTASGIRVKLTMDNQMTLSKLREHKDQLRAALRLKSSTRLDLVEGSTGGHAVMTLRTRSQADSIDMNGWKPGDAWAVDTVTGEPVPVPLGKRILFAGASGSGKTAGARPLLAEASEADDHRLVIFDRKFNEADNWRHRARIATELDEMRDLCEELEAEGEARKLLIPRGQSEIEISNTRPRITVFVDEGAELIEDTKTKHPVDGEGRKSYDDIMVTLRTIARKYRYVEIVLIWCTQKPALSGEGHGLDSQISGNIMMRLSLALSMSSDSRVVFGDDADKLGWKAHELPMPGYALFRNQELGPKSVPHMLKMRYMTAKQVIDLPDKPVWQRETGRASKTDVAARKALEAAPADPWAVPDDAATLVLDGDDLATEGSGPTARVPAADRDDQIMAALRSDPCVRLADLARAVGIHKQTVKRSLDRMAADGLVVRDDQGCWSPLGS
jgi:hypothetical protein